MTLLINCDLGESFGAWSMGQDEAVMPFIDQASIACGFHAGDPLTIRRTLQLAKKHQVSVGAHTAYPDLAGFGRRSMQCSPEEIIAFMIYQVAALDGMAKSEGLELSYVKPHGALYNDMMAKPEVRKAVMQALASFYRPLPLMLQATSDAELYQHESDTFGLKLLFEAFADRCYADDGSLLSRSLPGSVHSKEKMLAQVDQINRKQTITTISGKTLLLKADTLCVHGDNMEAVQAIAEIRELVD